MKTPISVADVVSSAPDLKLDHRNDAKNDTKQDILQHLLKRGEVTAQDLAEKLDISPQAIRKHLKDLETEGLIYHTAEQLGLSLIHI